MMFLNKHINISYLNIYFFINEVVFSSKCCISLRATYEQWQLLSFIQRGLYLNAFLICGRESIQAKKGIKLLFNSLRFKKLQVDLAGVGWAGSLWWNGQLITLSQ